VAYNTADAWRLADDARIETGYYGFMDQESVPVACDKYGETADGNLVTTAWPCIFAVIS
jgi:hypothetical protein